MAGRLPQDWFTGPVEVRRDRDELLIIGSLAEPDITDDAGVIAGSVTASTGSAAIVGDVLRWSGPLTVAPAAGSTVTVTFSVLVHNPDTGNRTLRNELTATGPGAVATAAAAESAMVVRSAPVLVTAASGGLAFTGVDAGAQLGVGGLAIAA